jgi:hypothetical protein
LFSSIQTWDGLCTFLQRSPTLADLEGDSFLEALDEVKANNGGLYTGAFILCATDAFGRGQKHKNHAALLQQMFDQNDLGRLVAEASSMQDVFEALKTYPLIGDFMAYQLAIDINYSDLTRFSENEFVRPGPGAVRGIRKVFESTGELSMAEAINWMVENQDAEFERLGLDFRGLHGRRLHAIDCQGLFCEVDKYCREAVPALKSARSRIKQRFVPSEDPIEYYFPPKWGLNVQDIDRGRFKLGASLAS